VALLDDLVAEADGQGGKTSLKKLSRLATPKAIAKLPDDRRTALLLHVLDRLGDLIIAHEQAEEGMLEDDFDWTPYYRAVRRLGAMRGLAQRELGAELTWDDEIVAQVWEWRGAYDECARYPLATDCLLGWAESRASIRSLTESDRAGLRRLLRDELLAWDRDADIACRKRIAALLGIPSIEAQLSPGEPWGELALADLAADAPNERAAWYALLEYAAVHKGSKPTKKWLKGAAPRIAAIGQQPFIDRCIRWFRAAGEVRVRRAVRESCLSEAGEDLLRGLTWCCCDDDDPALAKALGILAGGCLYKLPGYGPRAQRAGNSAAWALGEIATPATVTELALLQSQLKGKAAQKALQRALSAAAAGAGVDPTELAEANTPTFGLTEVGERQEAIGDFTAILTIDSSTTTTLAWRKPDGKMQKSVPKSVKDHHGEALKSIKKVRTELKKQLPVQRARLESLCRDPREFELDEWRTRWADHPLVGWFARRLVWRFGGATGVAAVWTSGGFVDVAGGEVEPVGPVTLWHPLECDASEVEAWRSALNTHDIVQPFKQAHREIYVLTDAERGTGTYSNRFAGHILRQHQLHALCEARGWSQSLAGAFDSDPSAAVDLPNWGWRVEFWMDTGDLEELSPAGIALYVATDQVRFYRGDASRDDPESVDAVPARLFSELMRDVDLFVGVSSIGNNPEWQDGGPDGRWGAYWTSFSFGDLGATARVRREVLERLLPRLKIGDQCVLQDKFLRVQGTRRAYKIHLGSSNILMEPNDQYLCIVRSRGAAATRGGKVMLPFEGDGVLSTILSKAFMLADDAKITDKTILSQLEHR
jgi:hypothetical protein